MNILFTLGDCNGIGIEVMIKAIREFDACRNINLEDIAFSIIANYNTLQEYLGFYGADVLLINDYIKIGDRVCKIIPCENYSPVEFGKETLSAGKLAQEALIKSYQLLKKHEYDAVVTMPVSKHSLHLAGWQYPGQTEFFTQMSGVQEPLMILCTDFLRVALVTIHEPIRKVADLLNIDNIADCIQRFNLSLKFDYNVVKPKIAVLSLNPHAGENGDIGSEENDIIIPAIRKANKRFQTAFGPFASDGFFAHGDYQQYDGILAMYHDQGLIPLKLLAKEGGVNFSANLPIVRTSPDHGTGFSISGTNIANPQSTLDAINLAISVVNNRKAYYEKSANFQ